MFFDKMINCGIYLCNCFAFVQNVNWVAQRNLHEENNTSPKSQIQEKRRRDTLNLRGLFEKCVYVGLSPNLTNIFHMLVLEIFIACQRV